MTGFTNNTSGLSLDGSVDVGTPYTATYTYDPALPDTASDPLDGIYGPLTSFEMTFGNYVIANVGASSIRVIDGLFGFDFYSAQTGLGIVQSGSFGGSFTSLGGFFAVLNDPTATALSSAALQVPDFSQFSSATWELRVIECPCDPETLQLIISGTVTSLVEVPPPTAIPEPTTLLLVAAGTAPLVRRRFRARR